MKKISLFLCAFFSLSGTVSDNPTIFSTIQSINLSSLEWTDEEWPNEPYHDYLMRTLNYQTNPQPAKKRRVGFRILHTIASKRPQNEHNSLSDMHTAQDLALFCGQKVGDPYLAEIVSRAKTELGRIYLYGLMASPTNNIDLLEKRQTMIKRFVHNFDAFKELREVYDQFTATENILLSFWAQDGFLQCAKRRYFSLPYLDKFNEQLNSSDFSLNVRSVLNHGKRGFYFASSVFAAVLLPIYGWYILNDSQLPSPFDQIASHLQGSGGRILGMISSAGNTAIAASATVAAGIYCALGCKEDYLWVTDNVTLDICLQKKMFILAQFFDALTKLKKTIDMFALDDVPPAKKIAEFFEETILRDNDLMELLNLCQTSSFHGDPSIFTNQGRILLAFSLMYKTKEKFEPLLMALAELDTYLSVAALYNEFKDERVHFCFVDYLKAPTCALTIKNFWNPFIDRNKVVANDLSLEAFDRRNMVITGPNAGGKSTLIKAIAMNLILSQSLCIGAADTLALTPFYSIGTYLNVVDNIAAGNSLFKAQVLRAQQMVDIVEKTPKDAFSFIALDEMFNGTSAKESKVIAYSVGNHIGQFTNNICVMATHFPLLTQLAHENSAFANYKVSVDVDQSQGIHYPFKLERGLSNQHIALDILREEGYACSIVEEALRMLQNKIDQ